MVNKVNYSLDNK